MEMKIEKHDDAVDIESDEDDEEIDDVKIDGSDDDDGDDDDEEEEEDEEEDEDIDETDDDDDEEDEDDSKEDDLGTEYQVQPVERNDDEIEAASKRRKPRTENTACRGEDDERPSKL